jgi:thiol-disulfide isomerase/thioredoxin
MGKAERIRQASARERIAAQQAAARRAESRRRMFIAGGSVFGVLVIVIVLIVAKAFTSTPAASGPASASGSTAASVAAKLSTVPAATLNAVGKGSASPLIATKGQPPLTADGKPRIVYMGAEYCPYCAAERWAMVVALSRFGSFSGLQLIHSSSSDVYPNTPTLTFAHAKYTSKYVDFSPVEMYGLKDNGVAFQKPTSAESALMTKYDAAPYVPSADASSFPFVDIGNQYLVIGAQYLPSNLAGLTWSKVASDVQDPASAVAKGIDGTANSLTAAICKITKNAPASVCNSAAAKAGAGTL